MAPSSLPAYPTDPQARSGESPVLDLLVIGGGINGAGVARDAARRGLQVVLCERDDLAQGTSSRSSGLIHGGLRYLENYEFRLVRESLQERATLLRVVPHLARPMHFVLPVVPGMRPAWMMQAGMLLYDHLGDRAGLAPGRFARDPGAPWARALLDPRPGAWIYSDCQTDDARLVVATAQDAQREGAVIRPRTEVFGARREGSLWRVQVRPAGAAPQELRARAIVNAAGPWVAGLRSACGGQGQAVRLVQGSHIVLPRLYEGDNAFLLQNPDGRVVFVVPWPHGMTMVGTTDVRYEGDPATVQASEAEVDYLCQTVRRQLRAPISPGLVVHRYSGVRCLVDDASENPSKVTRDYRIEVDAPAGQAPALHILGGKLTTYRRLAQNVVDKLSGHFARMRPCTTTQGELPGSEGGRAAIEDARRQIAARLPALDAGHRDGLVARHGVRAAALLQGAGSVEAMGRYFGGGLFEIEVEHLRAHEWARQADDVLWRRTKAGLGMNEGERAAFAQWWEGR